MEAQLKICFVSRGTFDIGKLDADGDSTLGRNPSTYLCFDASHCKSYLGPRSEYYFIAMARWIWCMLTGVIYGRRIGQGSNNEREHVCEMCVCEEQKKGCGPAEVGVSVGLKTTGI